MPNKNLKIGLLGDVHANLPALETVLEHAENLGVTEYWNIGDFVGYNAFPDQVVRRMKGPRFSSIIGNYDLKVLNFPKKNKKWRRNKHPLKWQAFKWAYENLSPESRIFLASLPAEQRLTLGDLNFLLVHASLTSNEELLDKTTPGERLMELKSMAEEKYECSFAAIIFGHSHQPFTRRTGETLFVNTGSVGRPGDGNPRTAYAVMEVLNSTLRVTHYRLDYDLDKIVSANRKAGFPQVFTRMILEGRDLDWISGS
jgi:predicted phosphodiesterase